MKLECNKIVNKANATTLTPTQNKSWAKYHECHDLKLGLTTKDRGITKNEDGRKPRHEMS
jgi:hypothetical protein